MDRNWQVFVDTCETIYTTSQSYETNIHSTDGTLAFHHKTQQE